MWLWCLCQPALPFSSGLLPEALANKGPRPAAVSLNPQPSSTTRSGDAETSDTDAEVEEQAEEEVVEGGEAEADYGENAELLERCQAMDFLFATSTLPSRVSRATKRPRETEETTGAASSGATLVAARTEGLPDTELPLGHGVAVPATPEPAEPLGVPLDTAQADAAPDAVPRRRGASRVGAADALAVVFMQGGRIAYHLSKDAFEATCYQHPNCNLSRTAKARRSGAGGRPCGLLATWLADESCATKGRAQSCRPTALLHSRAESSSPKESGCFCCRQGPFGV